MHAKVHVSMLPGIIHLQYPIRWTQSLTCQKPVSGRERKQQKQAKQGSADPLKQQQEAAAQAAQTPTDLSSGSALVEDRLLPKSGMQPPAADPVGKGLLSAQELSGMLALVSCLVSVSFAMHVSIMNTLGQLCASVSLVKIYGYKVRC